MSDHVTVFAAISIVCLSTLFSWVAFDDYMMRRLGVWWIVERSFLMILKLVGRVVMDLGVLVLVMLLLHSYGVAELTGLVIGFVLQLVFMWLTYRWMDHKRDREVS